MKKWLINRIEYKLLFKYEYAWWDIGDYISQLSDYSLFRVVKEYLTLDKKEKQVKKMHEGE